jgi:hypothetical protein
VSPFLLLQHQYNQQDKNKTHWVLVAFSVSGGDLTEKIG